jgi:hypothetical protein
MTWREDAPQSLANTFDGALGTPGTVIAAACTDETGTAVAVRPGGPTEWRFEIGSVTKTMTATLLALLEADGTLRLDDEVSRWPARERQISGPGLAGTRRRHPRPRRRDRRVLRRRHHRPRRWAGGRDSGQLRRLRLGARPSRAAGPGRR